MDVAFELIELLGRDNMLFKSILGFNKPQFLPHKTTWLVVDYTLAIFVWHLTHWSDIFARLLNNHRMAGSHSGIVSVLPAQITVYAWAQVDKRPHGVREPGLIQCQNSLCGGSGTVSLQFYRPNGSRETNRNRFQADQAILWCKLCKNRFPCDHRLPEVDFPDSSLDRKSWTRQPRAKDWMSTQACL
jgi:hypothetical protein